VLVAPDVTVVKPLITIVGRLVPALWHIVHVELDFPETPLIPFGYALAGEESSITASITRIASNR